MGCGEETRDEAILSGGGLGGTMGDGSAGDDGIDPSGVGDDSPGGGVKLDVGGSDAQPCIEGDCDMGCTGVDLLFVIDNSTSMGDYQRALGEAFPAFADAVVQALPSGINLHIGVTSTEMGFSGSGSTQNCTATGENGQPVDAFYVTPDDTHTDRNGAQGRLYVAGGRPYFDIDTNASPEALAELKSWFAEAANIGEGGSNIEMSLASAAWATDPANADVNGGFLRDEGAVLVVFFIQDEPDQSPGSVADAMVAKIAQAKQGCGGLDCVVTGGFVDEWCLPEVPLGKLFEAVPGNPVTASLPHEDSVSAADFEAVLRDTLAQVIADKCEEITPVG